MSDLDHYLDDFGSRLRRARPPRGPRRSLVLTGALATATAIALALLLVTPGRGGGPIAPVDAIAAVRQALDPANAILHIRIRTDLTHGAGGARHAYQETWTAKQPQRWRLHQWTPGRHNAGLAQRIAYADGELSFLQGGRLTVEQGIKEGSRQARLPTLVSQNGDDPDVDLRALLDSGKLTDEGEVQADGRTVRRLVSQDGIRTAVFDVDPTTFVPLGGSFTFKLAHASKLTVAFTVEVFERLPITPETERHLALRVPEGTHRYVISAADMRRREEMMRAWEKRCVRRGSGNVVCPAPPHELSPTGS